MFAIAKNLHFMKIFLDYLYFPEILIFIYRFVFILKYHLNVLIAIEKMSFLHGHSATDVNSIKVSQRCGPERHERVIRSAHSIIFNAISV